ncbi:MAG: adenylosuccinate synthase [Candidatus Bathyarchaeia archaeon]
MACTVVVGAQFGDEGKGRIIDYLAAKADFVVRFQGGNNAGHTVVNDYGTFKLHLIPSGIFYPQVVCINGAGAVVDPDSLLDEIATLEKAGVKTDNLWIDRRAHIVWPYHRLLDGAGERKGGLGTTRRGIGPVYGDKAAYRGIRVGDLLHIDFLQTRLKSVLPLKNHELEFYGLAPLRAEDLIQQAREWGGRLGARIVDSRPILNKALAEGKKVLLEGQLGAMRDLDWGIYPYSTASSPTAGGACAGAGVSPRSIENIIGVVKAYTTAVGGGPFPTELFDKDGERLREIGEEYGATTKRPRRCGWLDGVVVRYAASLNGLTSLAVTKLDVLDSLENMKVCIAYRLDGKETTEMPDTVDLGRVQPVYEEWAGWKKATTGARRWDDLPKGAQAYLKRIEELAKVPIQYVSVGAKREDIVIV